jgi:hypothetical protein
MNHKHYHVSLVSKGHDIAKILLMLGLKINQSIKQSIKQSKDHLYGDQLLLWQLSISIPGNCGPWVCAPGHTTTLWHCAILADKIDFCLPFHY